MINSDLPRLPARSPDSHKGDYGRAVLVGGSAGMAGAIALAGMATLRGGAGLVQLAVPRGSQAVVASFEPSYMTVALPEDSEGRIAFVAVGELLGTAERATALACGAGLGRSAELTRLVIELYRDVKSPMIFDADALNALAELPDTLEHGGGPRILTPHPLEFARLLGRQSAIEPAEREPLARQFAQRTGTVVVLKGHRTVITDGQQSALNTTGNPGMATGGTGDVLTGIITALLCQGMSPFDAARLGAHLHGLAGDLAAAKFGQPSMIARDLITFLPNAMRSAAPAP